MVLLADESIISGAVQSGWLLDIFASLPQIIVSFLFAFIAGSISIFSTCSKKELPERESRFWAIALGVTGYAVLFIINSSPAEPKPGNEP